MYAPLGLIHADVCGTWRVQWLPDFKAEDWPEPVPPAPPPPTTDVPAAPSAIAGEAESQAAPLQPLPAVTPPAPSEPSAEPVIAISRPRASLVPLSR